MKLKENGWKKHEKMNRLKNENIVKWKIGK